jgi:predicted transcriptional regulator
MSKSLVELTAEITTAQARLITLSPEAVADSMCKIFETLQTVHYSEYDTPFGNTISRNPEASIQQNQVICVECGNAFTLLSNRHLALHGLTPRTYKQKHGIRLTQPLSARSLTATRRKRARDHDIGKHLAAWRSERKLKAS